MWNCVEDRVEHGGKFGRIIRKIIFEDVYTDRESVICRVPVTKATLTDLKAGDRVAFQDNCEIREGSFLCSSEVESLDAKAMVSEVLSTEEDIRNFCLTNSLCSENSHLFTMVIESFIFLSKKLSPSCDNTTAATAKPEQKRKRPFPHLSTLDGQVDGPSSSPRVDPPRPIEVQVKQVKPRAILQPSTRRLQPPAFATSSDFDVKPFIEESNSIANTANDVEFFIESLQSAAVDIDSQVKTESNVDEMSIEVANCQKDEIGEMESGKYFRKIRPKPTATVSLPQKPPNKQQEKPGMGKAFLFPRNLPIPEEKLLNKQPEKRLENSTGVFPSFREIKIANRRNEFRVTPQLFQENAAKIKRKTELEEKRQKDMELVTRNMDLLKRQANTLREKELHLQKQRKRGLGRRATAKTTKTDAPTKLKWMDNEMDVGSQVGTSQPSQQNAKLLYPDPDEFG